MVGVDLALPREGHDLHVLVELEHLDGHVLIADAEDLEDRVERLLRLGVLVHLVGVRVRVRDRVRVRVRDRVRVKVRDRVGVRVRVRGSG